MIVISGDFGQLGNRLTVFANLIAGACEHGLRIANPAFHGYAGYFEATQRDLWCRYPPRPSAWPPAPGLRRRLHRGTDVLRRYARKFRNRTGRWPPLLRVIDIGWRERCDVDGPEFLALARRPGLLIARGWLFRALGSFERHAETVRNFFTPVARHRRPVAALLGRLRRSADVVVGVHVRHGDYRQFLGGRYFLETAQYAALMRRMRALLAGRRVAFLVCSNAGQSAETLAGLDVTPGTGHELEDLYALASCDYLIGPPSTYTMWASFWGRVPLRFILDPDAPLRLEDFQVFRNLHRCTREYAEQPGLLRAGASAPPAGALPQAARSQSRAGGRGR